MEKEVLGGTKELVMDGECEFVTSSMSVEGRTGEMIGREECFQGSRRDDGGSNLGSIVTVYGDKS
jgi:hypothetical protein